MWARYARVMFLVPALAYVLFAFVLPIVYNLILSFEQTSPATIASLFASFAGIDNYKAVLIQPTTQSAIVRTFSFTFLSLLFQFLIGFGLAMLFNLKFPLRRVARSLVIIPWLLPLLITGFIFRFLFQAEAGAVNQILLDVHLISHPIGFLTTPGWAFVAILIANIWLGAHLQRRQHGRQLVQQAVREAAPGRHGQARGGALRQPDHQVLQEASAGDLPNIVMLDNPNVPEVAATGQLKPLDGLPGFTTSGYVPGAISECTYQGKHYCYPIGTNTVGIFYNKAMLAAAHVSPPRTWAQLQADATKLTNGHTYGIEFDATSDEQSTWQLEPYFWSQGGNLDNWTARRSSIPSSSGSTWSRTGPRPSQCSGARTPTSPSSSCTRPRP